jgi:hypothetical protein
VIILCYETVQGEVFVFVVSNGLLNDSMAVVQINVIRLHR